MATPLAVTLLTCLLLGILGRALKPVAFVALLAPALTVATALPALRGDLSWLQAGATFYAGLAVAEFAYLGALLLGNRPQLRPARDRSV